MKRIFLKYALAAALLASAGQIPAASRDWETVQTGQEDMRQVAGSESLRILAGRSAIIVSSSQTVRIKVFTILGRLVSEATLQPGNARLTFDSPGIYIVKAGDLTCKVAI